ncbi:MAG: serine/threonine protein kinase [Myxococcales bacterium]|nr:serine/threonine protein kinase [Myxococcales bacterium]
MTSASPRLTERYRVLERLGSGGMGEVYAARDETEQRDVAVKILSVEAAQDLESIARFVREARLAERVVHENVVRVLELGTTDAGTPFLVLERLVGETLEARLLRGQLSLVDAARVGVGILAGLEAIHAEQVIHRDVKPANVFLVGGSVDRVKLIDFGVAKLLGDRGLTRTGTLVGTPVYMAPEQLRDEGVDMRTDIYGAGATLYEALTGRPPFVEDGARLYKAVLTGALVPLRDLRPSIDPELASIVHTALAKDSALRFRTAIEMHERLAAWLALASNRVLPSSRRPREGGSVRPPSAPAAAVPDGGERRAKRARSPLGVGVAAVVGALVLVSLAAGALAAVVTRPRKLVTPVRALAAPPEAAAADASPPESAAPIAPSSSEARSAAAKPVRAPTLTYTENIGGGASSFISEADADRIRAAFMRYRRETLTPAIRRCLVPVRSPCEATLSCNVSTREGTHVRVVNGHDCFDERTTACLGRIPDMPVPPLEDRPTEHLWVWSGGYYVRLVYR